MVKCRAERIIWQNYDIEIDKGYYDSEYPEMTEEQRYMDTLEMNNMWIEDERINLDIQLDNPIIVIADIGTWKGRRQGYKIINSGNIKDILHSECDYSKWYSDGYNIKAEMTHHDGTNYLEYREIRDMENIDTLLDKIYSGQEISRSQLNYYTKSILPEVANVYGW